MFCEKPSITGRLYSLSYYDRCRCSKCLCAVQPSCNINRLSYNIREWLPWWVCPADYWKAVVSSRTTWPAISVRLPCSTWSTSSTSKKRCQHCKVVGKPAHFTQWKCPDCLGEPALNQTSERDCHSLWHSPFFDGVHSLWFIHHEVKQQQKQSNLSEADTATAAGTAGVSRGPGCPKGQTKASWKIQITITLRTSPLFSWLSISKTLFCYCTSLCVHFFLFRADWAGSCRIW